MWSTASTSGGSRVLGLLAATGVPVEFLPVGGDSGTDVPAEGRAAVGSASSGAGRDHPAPDAGGWTAVSGPLLALVRDSGRPLPLLPSGGTSGGAVAAEWLIFGLVWGGRRIRRSGLAPTAAGRRQPVSGTGPGPASRRWPRPRMWIRVTRCQRQSPLALVTSNVALKR
jgi:hypothetical protein